MCFSRRFYTDIFKEVFQIDISMRYFKEIFHRDVSRRFFIDMFQGVFQGDPPDAGPWRISSASSEVIQYQRVQVWLLTQLYSVCVR